MPHRYLSATRDAAGVIPVTSGAIRHMGVRPSIRVAVLADRINLEP